MTTLTLSMIMATYPTTVLTSVSPSDFSHQIYFQLFSKLTPLLSKKNKLCSFSVATPSITASNSLKISHLQCYYYLVTCANSI